MMRGDYARTHWTLDAISISDMRNDKRVSRFASNKLTDVEKDSWSAVLDDERRFQEGSKKVNTFGFGQINPLKRHQGVGIFILIEFTAVIYIINPPRRYYGYTHSATVAAAAAIDDNHIFRQTNKNRCIGYEC